MAPNLAAMQVLTPANIVSPSCSLTADHTARQSAPLRATQRPAGPKTAFSGQSCAPACKQADRATSAQRPVVVRAAVATGKPAKREEDSGIKVEESREPNCRVVLKVTVPAKTCARIYDEVIKDISKKAKVPGFRAGKPVPIQQLNAYFGKDAVISSVVEAVLKETMHKALESVVDQGIKDSEHIRDKGQKLVASFSPNADFTYEIGVDVMPTLAWKTPEAYKGLSLTVEVEPVEEKLRLAELEYKKRLKDLGSLRVAVGRPAQMGDVIIVDIQANRVDENGEKGEVILAATQKGFQLDTEEERTVMPGFIEPILGMALNETKEFDLTFPETWVQENLRGVKARFTATCKEIFVRNLPEETDEIAGKIVEGCSTLDEVKENLRSTAREAAQAQKTRATQRAILDKLRDLVEVEVPKSVLEDTGRNMYAEKVFALQIQQKVPAEMLARLAEPEMVQHYLVTQKEEIERTAATILATSDIMVRESLKVSEEDVDKEIKQQVAEFEAMKTEYDAEKLREQARETLEGLLVIDFVQRHAEITYVEKSSET